MPDVPRGIRRLAAAPIALLAVAALAGPAAATGPSHDYTAGAAGVGDRLFPTLGNGGYDALHYDLGLSYPSTAPEQAVKGVVVMHAVATHGLSRFNLDFSGDAVHGVWVGGRSARWHWEDGELTITPASPIRRHRRFTTTVTFTSGPDAPGPDPGGQFPSDPFPAGWFTTADGSVTAGQPDRSNEIYPVNDHPSDKATYRYTLVVPRGTFAAANGRRTGRHDVAGRTVWTYEMDEPMASQLIQLAVGDLVEIRRASTRGVELRDVVARTAVATSEPTLATTPAHMRWVMAKVGRYPFDTYGVLVADQLFFYALETQTLSLHPSFLFDPEQFDQDFAQTILVHELAHQWFGDDVAIAAWSDLWLSEGHATWYEQEFAAERFGSDFEAFMRNEYAIADQERAANGPVALPASPETLFSNNVYGGGALVLYALRQVIGDRMFRQLEREFARRYSGKSVSTEEFIALASKVARRDLRAFLRSWLYGTTTPPMPGHPDWTTDVVAASARSVGRVVRP